MQGDTILYVTFETFIVVCFIIMIVTSYLEYKRTEKRIATKKRIREIKESENNEHIQNLQ